MLHVMAKGIYEGARLVKMPLQYKHSEKKGSVCILDNLCRLPMNLFFLTPHASHISLTYYFV